MKRKKLFISIVTLLLIFGGINLFFQKTEAASKKVTKVTCVEKWANAEEEYGIVKGLNKNGKTIWKYKTRKAAGFAGSSIQYKIRKNRVYVVSGDYLVTLKKQTGKIIWKKTLAHIYVDQEMCFDSSGNIYITAGGGSVYKLNSRGKILWENAEPQNYYSSEKISYGKNKVIVRVNDLGNQYKLYFSAKTGRLLKKKRV